MATSAVSRGGPPPAGDVFRVFRRRCQCVVASMAAKPPSRLHIVESAGGGIEFHKMAAEDVEVPTMDAQLAAGGTLGDPGEGLQVLQRYLDVLQFAKPLASFCRVVLVGVDGSQGPLGIRHPAGNE